MMIETDWRDTLEDKRCDKPKNTGNCQKLEGKKKKKNEFSPEPLEETGPINSLTLASDSGFLTSRTKRE